MTEQDTDFRDDGSELIDHCDDVSHPPLATQPQSSQSSALLSYGDGAGHNCLCADNCVLQNGLSG